MSTEAIAESSFVGEFTRELHNKNAAIFAGAGLSMASGYVDWKGLLKEIIVAPSETIRLMAEIDAVIAHHGG